MRFGVHVSMCVLRGVHQNQNQNRYQQCDSVVEARELVHVRVAAVSMPPHLTH